jgi:hypothetical protein
MRHYGQCAQARSGRLRQPLRIDGIPIVRWLVGRNDEAVGRYLRIVERESGECTVMRKEPTLRTQYQRVEQKYIFIHQIPPH